MMRDPCAGTGQLVICVNHSQRTRGTRWREAAEFFVVLVGALCLRTLGDLWGLIVAEKPNLFASHKHFFPSYC
jgi:hypothetical protein